jgi:dihydropteridine reductase
MPRQRLSDTNLHILYSSIHTQLDGFISLPNTGDLTELTLQLVRGVHYFLHGSDMNNSKHSNPHSGLDAIIVASGGWSQDPKEVAHDNSEQTMEENAVKYCSVIEEMRRKNLDPCLASGYIAQHFMNPSGLMVVMGATAALQPTPGMVGYGLSKSAAHFYVQTLGACTGHNLDNKSIRKEGTKARQGTHTDSLSVVGILPTTIDTAANRRAFPHGDYSEWVRPLDIATEVASWINEPALRPHSGSLVKVRPSEQQQGASFELVR